MRKLTPHQGPNRPRAVAAQSNFTGVTIGKVAAARLSPCLSTAMFLQEQTLRGNLNSLVSISVERSMCALVH